MSTQDVITRSDSGCGHITLNRPKALNALTLDMCRSIIAALQSWQADPDTGAVIIDHGEGRGFCAGGDIRVLFESLKGDGREARDFFRTEYGMNHLLFEFKKPTICFMDGVVMGGGAGIAMPCRYRVASELTMFAMPETGIGLFPDVGGGWFLSRLPGRIGQWLAMTGARLNGADCMSVGLATHYLPHDALAQVKLRIANAPDAIDAILRDAAMPPPMAGIDRQRHAIDRLFASDRVEDIVAALKADPSPWAAEQLAQIEKKSPRSCKIALRQLSLGRRFTRFSDNMRMEFRMATRLIEIPDFIEGVRAFVIDKDNRPAWTPPRFEDVSDGEIDAIFAPLPAGEEWTELWKE